MKLAAMLAERRQFLPVGSGSRLQASNNVERNNPACGSINALIGFEKFHKVGWFVATLPR